MTTTFEDARRYLNLAQSGWKDPEVDPMALIAELCDAHESALSEVYSSEEFDSAVEEARRDAESDMWDEDEVEQEIEERLQQTSVADLLELLDRAIERERTERVRVATEQLESTVEGLRSSIAWRDIEIGKLRREVEDLKVTQSADRAVLALRMTEPRKKVPVILPDAAAKRTKKALAIMERFNKAVDHLIFARGGLLVASGDALEGEQYRRYELETRAGLMTISTQGNAVMCRFADPQKAATLGLHNLNDYSGKWNHHYFGQELDAALAAVADTLDSVCVKEAA